MTFLLSGGICRIVGSLLVTISIVFKGVSRKDTCVKELVSFMYGMYDTKYE